MLCGYGTRRNSAPQISHYLIKEVSPLALNFQAFGVLSYETIYCNFFLITSPASPNRCYSSSLCLRSISSFSSLLVSLALFEQSHLSVTHSTELSFAVVMFIKLLQTLNQHVQNYCSQKKYMFRFLQASGHISVKPKCCITRVCLPTSL